MNKPALIGSVAIVLALIGYGVWDKTRAPSGDQAATTAQQQQLAPVAPTAPPADPYSNYNAPSK